MHSAAYCIVTTEAENRHCYSHLVFDLDNLSRQVIDRCGYNLVISTSKYTKVSVAHPHFCQYFAKFRQQFLASITPNALNSTSAGAAASYTI